MLRCTTTPKTADKQAIRAIRCRGEDSNLCPSPVPYCHHPFWTVGP